MGLRGKLLFEIFNKLMYFIHLTSSLLYYLYYTSFSVILSPANILFIFPVEMFRSSALVFSQILSSYVCIACPGSTLMWSSLSLSRSLPLKGIASSQGCPGFAATQSPWGRLPRKYWEEERRGSEDACSRNKEGKRGTHSKTDSESPKQRLLEDIP